MGQFGHNLAHKMMYPYNLEFAFRNLLKVSTMKWTQGHTKVHKDYIVSFSEEVLVWGKWAILGPI